MGMGDAVVPSTGAQALRCVGPAVRTRYGTEASTKLDTRPTGTGSSASALRWRRASRRVRSGRKRRPTVGIAKSSARGGGQQKKTCCDEVHRVDDRLCRTGVVVVDAHVRLGQARVRRADLQARVLVPSESSWWPASLPRSGRATRQGRLVARCRRILHRHGCGSSVSRKQAFATDEASANSHTSSTTNAVLRLARVFEKGFMFGEIVRLVHATSRKAQRCLDPHRSKAERTKRLAGAFSEL